MKTSRHSISLLFLFIVAGSLLSFAQEKKQFILEDIFSGGKFVSKSVRGVQWMKNGKSFTYLDMDTVAKTTGIFQYTIKDGSKKLLISPNDFKLQNDDPAFRFTTYQWSADEKNILLVSAPPEQQWLSRLTPAGNFFIYDVEKKKNKKITDVSVPQYNQKLSPDGKLFGFVRGNNIYSIDIATGKEIQLTNDGSENIINGRFDWVYEEEFGISDGWRWSPDGKSIAFWRLDQSRVPDYTMTEWDSTHGTLIKMKYPKAGDPNSIVKVGVIDLASMKTTWIDLGTNDDMYIPRMKWTNEKNIVSMQRLNRDQNKLELLFADVTTGKTTTILTDTSNTWIDIRDDITFLKNGQFVWSSERDGYLHFYLYKNDGTLVNQITKGEFDVDAFYGVNEKEKTLFYSSSEMSPIDRQVYSISLDGKKKKQLTKETGNNSANFSPEYNYFLNYYSNASTPTKIRLMEDDGSLVRVVEENEMKPLNDFALATTTFFSFKTSDGVSLHASLLTPANFDSTKKYSVLMYTYGGPGSQVVRNVWGGSNYLWYSMLAQKGYLVFMVDNRGTGARGAAFKKITYKNLGKWEVSDQVEGAKYLASLSFVDKNRIGIWGWSYGGYTSSMTILNGAEYFKTAVAVAPVTNWKFYDNIYTERFMSTPEKNPEGYKESAPLTHVAKLKGKFLLIHGASDDNVHFQNSATLVTALQNANKQFDTMFYPNQNHGIGRYRLHVFTKITNFILENL